MLGFAAAYLGFAFAISLTWHIPSLESYVPKWLTEWIYPIDKTNLDVLRFGHFLALAALTARLVRRDWAGLASPLLRPVILCGQHSLEIFCLSEFLSFAGHFAIVEVSGGFGTHVLVSVSGIVIMTATAAMITWYKKVEARTHGPRGKPQNADLAGG